MGSILLAYVLVGFVVFIINRDIGLAIKWPFIVIVSVFTFFKGISEK